MKPPDREEAPTGAPSNAHPHLTPNHQDPPQDTQVRQVQGWRDLTTERPQPSPEMLASPTLGAWRRANGVTDMCDFAKVALAVELVQEARRRVLLDRLDGVLQFLAVGGNPDHAIDRLVRLVDEYRGRGAELEAAA